MMTDADLLAFHRALVATPSLSGEEGRAAELVVQTLAGYGVAAEIWDLHTVVARTGQGPRLLLNSHLDTVPPGAGWTREPWQPTVEGDQVFGLGSNDAKASVAALVGAFLEIHAQAGPVEAVLLLTTQEETTSRGAEWAVPEVLAKFGVPDGGIVGEPTDHTIAVRQKGLMVLDLVAEGDAGHAAHAERLGMRNPIHTLAEDLLALQTLDRGPEDPWLGMSSYQPTVVQAGEARNAIPAEARAVVDVRSVPTMSHDEWLARIRSVVKSRVEVRSQRLEPYAVDENHAIVQAGLATNPQARVVGSATMSDLTWMRGFPAVKCGPGKTERSHQLDEFVLQSEIVAARAWYVRWAAAFAGQLTGGANA